jgi:hypothetical protein
LLAWDPWLWGVKGVVGAEGGRREAGSGKREAASSSVVVVVGDELASLVTRLCSFVITAGGGT